MADLERIYTIPLRSAYDAVRGKRSRKAVKIVRGFISRHMKAELENVSMSEEVNKLIWKRGIQKPPRKIKVRAVKAGENVSVLLVDEKVEEAKVEKAPKKKEREEPKDASAKKEVEKKAATPPVKEEKAEAKAPIPKPPGAPKEGEKEAAKPMEKDDGASKKE